MAGSVQVETRSALLPYLRAALESDYQFGQTGTAVFGWHSSIENYRERVWMRGGRADMQIAAQRPGATVLNEREARFYVFVEVVLPGSDQETATGRAYDLAGIVVRQVALHKADLGVTGLNWIAPGAVELDAEGQTDQGSAARVRVDINYDARVEQS